MMDKIKHVRALAAKLASRDGVALQGSCLHHALAAQRIFGGSIVAGTTSWKFTDLDNGSNPTHFSYVFEVEKLPYFLIQNRLPEMHVWNVFEGKVLDLTTRYLPSQALALAGFIWEPKKLPPDFHLGTAEHVNQDFLYVAHPLATKVALKLIAGIKMDEKGHSQVE